MNKEQEILELSVGVGEALLSNGAEVYRVHETILRIIRSYGIEDFHVYVISNAIFASIGEKGQTPYHAMRYVPLGNMHLGRIAAANALSRRIVLCRGKGDLHAFRAELLRCTKISRYPIWLNVLAGAIGAACFGYMLSGSFFDALATFFTVIPLQLFRLYCGTKVSKYIVIVLGGALVTALSIGFYLLGIGTNLHNIVIGAIIPMVPGITLTTAIRDFFNSDHLSGTIHLINALLVAVSIAVGVGVALQLWSLEPAQVRYAMILPVQFIVAFFATMAFTILFQAPMKYCMFGGVVGSLGWLLYELIISVGGAPAIAGFSASLILIVLARFFAVVFKEPSTMFLLAGIFPLVPGTGIYFTAYYLFAKDVALAGQYAMSTLTAAGVIALGLLFGSAVPQKVFDVLGKKIARK